MKIIQLRDGKIESIKEILCLVYIYLYAMKVCIYTLHGYQGCTLAVLIDDPTASLGWFDSWECS